MKFFLCDNCKEDHTHLSASDTLVAGISLAFIDCLTLFFWNRSVKPLRGHSILICCEWLVLIGMS